MPNARRIHRRAAVPALAAALAAGALGLAAGPAAASSHVLRGSRLRLVFADTATGFNGTTSDRLDEIFWRNSAGVLSGNYAKEGGPVQCGDPVEFFGESYGEPEGTGPGIMYAGVTASWKQLSATSASTTVGKTTCNAITARSTTTYTVYRTTARRNEFRISRTFKFSSSTSQSGNGRGLRPYVPRLDQGTFSTVIYPNAAGTALNTANSGACGGDCEVTDWNQRWFADDNGSGTGMVVIRAASSTAPALLTVNNDAFSFSNLSSVVLIVPAAGWVAPLAETEYLCFYDPTSWTSAMRSAMKLPKGCAVS
jgi:hypothetical protein